MCQLSAGALFKLKRERVLKYQFMFASIRRFRNAPLHLRAHMRTPIVNLVRVRIVGEVDRGDFLFAELLCKRAKKAGLLL